MHEAWLCIGRRGGKSFILAVVAVFLACFKDWRPYLGPGEVATIMIIARDRRQARVIKRFITGLLKSIPMLRQVIEGETQETIALRNSVSIEIHTACSAARVATPSSRRCWMRLRIGRSTRIAPSPTSKSSTRSDLGRRPSPAQCCSAPAHHTPARARCGARSPSTSARTTMRFWSGKPARAT